LWEISSKKYFDKERKMAKNKKMGKNKKKIIKTDTAPLPIGPYSAGVKVGRWVFTAGQIGINPETGEIVEGGIEAETRQVLTNLKNLLEAAGASLDQVVKTTVFLRDMGEFTQMNQVYAEFFVKDFPSRSTVQAAALPKAAAVEIDAVAIVGK
jgi:2-iminobutanoate/2-iminopropanoate deaminase